MARLTCKKTGRRVFLEPSHLVGRSEHCLLRLEDPHVSNEHASVRWDGECWMLKDLGSLNRTYLDGNELKPSDSVPLSRDSRIAFGSQAQTWTMDDDAEPAPMAVAQDGADAIFATDGLLPLPSPEQPLYTVYRSANGSWVVDTGDGILAEESGASKNLNDESEFAWIIDPIDGTTNFMHGYPNYCVSIALSQRGVITQAVIYDPVRNDLFTATKGAGAYLNDKRIRVRSTEPCTR